MNTGAATMKEIMEKRRSLRKRRTRILMQKTMLKERVNPALMQVLKKQVLKTIKMAIKILRGTTVPFCYGIVFYFIINLILNFVFVFAGVVVIMEKRILKVSRKVVRSQPQAATLKWLRRKMQRILHPSFYCLFPTFSRKPQY